MTKIRMYRFATVMPDYWGPTWGSVKIRICKTIYPDGDPAARASFYSDVTYRGAEREYERFVRAILAVHAEVVPFESSMGWEASAPKLVEVAC